MMCMSCFSPVMADLEKKLTEVLPISKVQPVLDILENLGVRTLEDFSFVEPDDLDSVLKRVESRKLLFRIQSK